MGWNALLVPDAAPIFLAALGMVLLAGVLFWKGAEHRASRVFASFLVLRGLTMFSAAMSGTNAFNLEDVPSAGFWAHMVPYFVIPIPFILFYFMLSYPRPRGGLGRWPGTPWILGITAIIIAAAYGSSASLFVTLEVGSDGFVYFDYNGPLGFFLGLMYLSTAVAAAYFSYLAVQHKPGPQRQTLLILALGFTLNSLFDATQNLYALFAGFVPPTSRFLLSSASIFPVALSVALIAWKRRHTSDDAFRRLAAWFLVLLPLPVLSVVTLIWDNIFPPWAPLGNLNVIPTGLWRLSLPILASYAMLRHNLFDVDLKFKVALRRGGVAGILASAFFVLSEVLEQVVGFEEALPAILSAGAIVVLLQPVRKATQRFMDRLMPGVADTPQFRESRKLDMYRVALEAAFQDDDLTPRERRILDRMQEKLEIDPGDASRLEQQVLGASL